MTDYDSSATNWNSAKRFSDQKIMDILYETDEYEIIAQHGYPKYQAYVDSSNVCKERIDYFKFNAFKFLVSKLIQVLRNSMFAITVGKVEANKYLKILRRIESNIIPKLSIRISDNRLRLKKSYKKYLNIVLRIKSLINNPLNKNNLIYNNKVDIDIEEEIKRDEDDFVELP